MQSSGLRRLQIEYQQIRLNPVPNALVVPDPQNWFEWHYVIHDLPPESDFHTGVYHGELRFPETYPYSPPSIIMHTPSGRFVTGMRICTSMSDYHPETWSPMWSITTILVGFISFMNSEENSTGTTRSDRKSRASLARKSMNANMKNSKFCSLF